jgi:hypothetical protein
MEYDGWPATPPGVFHADLAGRDHWLYNAAHFSFGGAR